MMSSFSLAVLFGVIVLVSGHSYMTNPRGRDNWQWNDCRLGGPDFAIKECHSITPYTEAGPCELPYDSSQRHHSSSRGAPLRVEWPRNNHPGGFVRLAWLQTSRTEDPNAHKLFDGNVQLYTCFEKVCRADPGGNGGDSLGTDGGCWIDTTIPNHLTDGQWTLQWTWYGGMYGEASDYYTCANFIIQGGNPVTAQQQPVFIGGDAANPNNPNVCQYFTTNRLHYCKREPCSEMCVDSTAPAGHCGWPPNHGPAYIDPLIATPTTANPPTSLPPPPTPTTAPPPDRIILVLVTVKVATPPRVFDVTTFVYSIANLLDIPAAAIAEVLVNLDQSDDSNTVIAFKIQNAVGQDGNPINPIEAAARLKELAENKDPSLSSFAILSGLEVVGTDVEGSSAAIAPILLVVLALIAMYL